MEFHMCGGSGEGGKNSSKDLLKFMRAEKVFEWNSVGSLLRPPIIEGLNVQH